MATERQAGRRAEGVLVRATVVTTLEHRERFLELARLLVSAAEQEPGAVAHRWCATADPLRFVAIEEYADETALFERSPAARELVTQLAAVTMAVEVQVHGAIGARLAAWIARNPHASAYPEVGH